MNGGSTLPFCKVDQLQYRLAMALRFGLAIRYDWFGFVFVGLALHWSGDDIVALYWVYLLCIHGFVIAVRW